MDPHRGGSAAAMKPVAEGLKEHGVTFPRAVHGLAKTRAGHVHPYRPLHIAIT